MPKGEPQAHTVTNEGRRANRKKKKGDRGRRQRGRKNASRSRSGEWRLDDVQAAYAACVRCGYFLSGYRLAVGTETLEAAVDDAHGAWLELPWTDTMRELLEKSFGIRLDGDVYHFKGCCSECARVFVLRRWEPGVDDDEDDEDDESDLSDAVEDGMPDTMADISDEESDVDEETEEVEDDEEEEEEDEPYTFRIQIRPRVD